MEFETAKDFANHIKSLRHEYAEEAEDLEERREALKEKYAKEILETGYDFSKKFTPVDTMYQNVIDGIIDEFYNTLATNVRDKFLKQFHFTTIDNRYANASIVRSKDKNFYGVFVNSTLITAIHRLGKLELAMLYPEMVSYCSRYPKEKVNRSQMIEIYSEVYMHFMATKLPLGPLVILNEPLNTTHIRNIKIQEQLIVFHELAHFLNGDLEQNADENKVSDIFLNISYQREHMADIVAFALLMRQYKYNSNLTKESLYKILLAIINLYKIQHQIQGIETLTYPHPLNRMAFVLETFYGKETEEWVADAIMNNKTSNLTFDSMPTPLPLSDIWLEYIDERLMNFVEVD